jgi:hypothetical protein
MKSKLSLFAGMIALCGTFNPASAATINWSNSALTGADADVLNTGGGYQLIGALSLVANDNNGTPAPTVNGVVFQKANITVGGDPIAPETSTPSYSVTTATSANLSVAFTNVSASNDMLVSSNPIAGSSSSASAGYKTLIGSAFYNYVSGPVGITISGLTVGETYKVVFFDQNPYGNQTFIWTADSQSSATGSVAGQITAGDQFVATFTATDTSETFSCQSGVNYYGALNAVEILEAVPEPSSVALLSVATGLIGLMAVRRFRAVPVA